MTQAYVTLLPFVWQILVLFSLLMIHRVINYRKKLPLFNQTKGLSVIRLTAALGLSDISIVIPAYNEANRIESSLLVLLDFLEKSSISAEIVIVDDGSLDDTFQLCFSIASIYMAKVIRSKTSFILASYHRNAGKGKAVAVGMLLCSGPKILIMDADGATNFKEILRFDKLIQDHEMLCGTRKLSRDRHTVLRHLFSKLFRHFKYAILGMRSIDDTQCGFKMLSRNVLNTILPQVKIEGWTFDIELILQCLAKGFSVRSLAVDWHDKSGSKLRLLEDVPTMFTDLCLLGITQRFK